MFSWSRFERYHLQPFHVMKRAMALGLFDTFTRAERERAAINAWIDRTALKRVIKDWIAARKRGESPHLLSDGTTTISHSGPANPPFPMTATRQLIESRSSRQIKRVCPELPVLPRIPGRSAAINVRGGLRGSAATRLRQR